MSNWLNNNAKKFNLGDISDQDIDNLVGDVAGVWPDFWSMETFKQVVIAGANLLVEKQSKQQPLFKTAFGFTADQVR